jgi:hypothetical protein
MHAPVRSCILSTMSTPYPNQTGKTPRSTPIPGAASPWSTPHSGPYAAPPEPPRPGPAIPPGGYQPPPFGQQPFQVPPPGSPGYQPPRRDRGFPWGAVVALLIVLSVGVGIFATIWGLNKANDVIDDAQRQINEGPTLNDSERKKLGVDDEDVVALWQGAAPDALAEDLDDEIPGAPTKFAEIIIYGDYAIATAQDPTRSERIDRYTWRNGSVDNGTPQSNRDDLEGKTFTVDEVPWAKLEALMDETQARLQIEDVNAQYFIIDKGTFGEEGLTVRAYVSGPRGSGYAQADETGTIVTVYGG